jgi:MbtH protein
MQVEKSHSFVLSNMMNSTLERLHPMMNETEDNSIYQVIINSEEQYSIWRQQSKIPMGWKPVGFNGIKSECLKYINDAWIDMRPKSLREQIDGQ